MATVQVKFTFAFMGAVTAIIIGLAIFNEFQKPIDRNPASQQEEFKFQPYEYFID